MDVPYSVKETLGKGGFGKVKRVILGDKQYALKTMRKKPTLGDDVVKEIVMLKDTADSPLTVNLHGNSLTGKPKILLELAGGSPSKYIKKTKWETRRLHTNKLYLFLNALLEELRSYQLVHYDIKPGNILLFPGMRMKIADFGLAQYPLSLDDPPLKKVYTKWYRPPEYIHAQSPKYTYAGDIWASGMTLIQYILGRPLFRPVDNEDLLEYLFETPRFGTRNQDKFDRRVRKGTLDDALDVKTILRGKTVPEEIVSAIQQMLVFNPVERLKYITITPVFERDLPYINPKTSGEIAISNRLYGTHTGGESVQGMIDILSEIAV